MTQHPISALRLYLYVLGYMVAVLLLFRLAFWAVIAPDMAAAFSMDALKAFYIGFRFDARIAALFTLPLGVALCIPLLAEALHRHARLVTFIYAPLFFLLIVVYAADFGFYAYLGNRVSRLLFELLADFQVAVEMVVQSYPIVWITCGIFAGLLLCLGGFLRILRRSVRVSPLKKRRALGFFAGFLVFALAVYGQINSSLFPLRWSHAYFTTDETIIALALNPVQNLWDTATSSSGDYSLERTREAYPRMAEFLLVDAPDPERLDYARYTAPQDRGTQPPPNVVIIFMESLSYDKTSFAPGNGNPTPHIKELAKESLFFTRFFANARTTARAVFTTMTGVPDITLNSTGSRNPLVVDQRVVANEFTGYDKYYLIGGNTSWANVRAVLAQNIHGLRILEENAWKAPRADVWGVSDYDLLQEANELFAARSPEKPFLAVIQTASYHKPYTVPPTPGFSQSPLSKEDKHNYGFESQEEYDSMRFTDFSLGEFMQAAKKREYYDNTIFFIFGDHGLKDPSNNMPGGYVAANLGPWHVPLLIHASPKLGLFTPGESDMPCSQIDVFPTAAGLAGIAYRNTTLGRDIFDGRYDGSRQVYIGGKDVEPVRLVSGEYCFFDNRAGKQALFRIDDASANDLSAQEPERFARMSRLTEDIDATARYMLFNNKKEKNAKGAR